MIEYYKNLSLENIREEIDGVWVEEVWRPINEWEERYMASNFGRIKSLSRVVKKINGTKCMRESFIMKQDNVSGYLKIRLSIRGKCKRFSSHRLIAMAFIPNPENKPEVNHNRGITWDNRVSELEWSTKKDNVLHAFRVLKRIHPKKGKLGALSKHSIPVVQLTISGEFVSLFDGLSEVKRKLNIDHSFIAKVCRGKQKTAHGYLWKYKSDYDRLIAEQIAPVMQQLVVTG